VVSEKIGLRMKYFLDLLIGGRIGLRFQRDWHLGKVVYTLRLTPEEFEAMQLTIDRAFSNEH
jgi:hypothetical protein